MKLDTWALKEAFKHAAFITLAFILFFGAIIGIVFGICKLIEYNFIAGITCIVMLMFAALVVQCYFNVRKTYTD